MRLISSPYGSIEILPCADPILIARLEMDNTLDVFRQPELQKDALVGIAESPDGCVCIAKLGHRIIGYATFHPPDEIERWSESRVSGLLELGAVESSKTHRGRHLARNLLEVGIGTGRYNDKIVIATIYQWHFDLDSTGLTSHAYRKLLERMYGSVGFEIFKTDDPEIAYYPGNSLMARIGEHASDALKKEFDRLRFLDGGWRM
ncbi:MAG: GNAT family N-acetyltransferase [Deinococcales bacterium]